jgi:hypothetical protein
MYEIIFHVNLYLGSMVWHEAQVTVLLPHVAALPLWQEILLQDFVPLFHIVAVFSAFLAVSYCVVPVL